MAIKYAKEIGIRTSRGVHVMGVGLGVLLTACLTPQVALGQCQLLVRESFRPGDRPHGHNGQLRNAQTHDTLKDYWPQAPSTGVMWMSNDQTGLATWAFAGSSLDPAEVDPLDPYNGTAFGDADGVALLPFTAPASAFTTSAEAVMLFFSTSATYMGYTSNPALLSNFETHGTLWMSLNGLGEWAINANGFNVVASGTAPIVGMLDSGWMHMEFTFDPIASTVSGRVMNTIIPPTPVTLTRPIAYFGMEAHNSWNVLNNLSISTGPRLAASVAGGGFVCGGGTAALTATTNATAPSLIRWSRSGGWPLADGPQPGGSVISGAQTAALTITNLSPADSGDYFCVVANECGNVFSNTATVTVPASGTGDGDGSGTTDGSDVQGFVNLLLQGGSPSSTFCAYDMDASGGVGVSDVAPFVAKLLAR